MFLHVRLVLGKLYDAVVQVVYHGLVMLDFPGALCPLGRIHIPQFLLIHGVFKIGYPVERYDPVYLRKRIIHGFQLKYLLQITDSIIVEYILAVQFRRHQQPVIYIVVDVVLRQSVLLRNLSYFHGSASLS